MCESNNRSTENNSSKPKSLFESDLSVLRAHQDRYIEAIFKAINEKNGLVAYHKMFMWLF